MDKSLDEIIKQKFSGKKQKGGAAGPKKGILKNGRFTNKKSPGKRPQGGILKRIGQQGVVKRPVGDARAKIALKQRSKITDARVLLTKKQRQMPKAALIKAGGLKTRKNRAKAILLEEDDELMGEEIDFEVPAPVLRRTVKNNYVLPRTLATMPPLPTFSRTVDTDPFDCYQPYERRPPMYPTEPIPLPMGDYFEDASAGRKGILRVNNPNSGHVSNALKARLYSTPDPRTPSGIFGRDRDPDKELAAQNQDLHSSASGYRIVVSNLHTSVTKSDIQELFEDIGPLLESRLVRPGVAEVIYKRLSDAESAVDTYHNRQLDGQPMKCLLVRPRNMSFKTTSVQRESSKLPLDLDTVHKVLFKR
uniref:CSON006870 protein n=1 Tax=Culicoides sonorensis TaxID=179676 RepID=A0A336LXG2_CULSO